MMKVKITRDAVGIVVWKYDAELELSNPFKNTNQESFYKTMQWGTTNYLFDFRARLYNYKEVENMFPELLDAMVPGTILDMELLFSFVK